MNRWAGCHFASAHSETASLSAIALPTVSRFHSTGASSSTGMSAGRQARTAPWMRMSVAQLVNERVIGFSIANMTTPWSAQAPRAGMRSRTRRARPNASTSGGSASRMRSQVARSSSSLRRTTSIAFVLKSMPAITR
jgi:hypothetical protein